MVVSLLLASVGTANISMAQENEVDSPKFDQSDLKIDSLGNLEFQTENKILSEQLSEEQISNQRETDNSQIPEEDELSDGEGIEENDNSDRSLSDEENSLDEIIENSEELSEEDKEILNDESELIVTESSIIDSGQLESGEWILYSDGQLYLDGIVTKEAAQAWSQHALSIKSILFAKSYLSGSFDGFFMEYVNVETVDFEEATLDEVTSFKQGFYQLSNLKKISFKDVHHLKSSLNNVERMFFECANLIDLDLSGFNTGNVTAMAGMFYGCSGLTELDVSGFDTGNVTTMAHMFRGCSGLTELDVSGFDTGNVTNMSEMFVSCSGLVELDVRGFDTGNVTDMSRMFNLWGGITELDVSGFDTRNVMDMSNMFRGCSGLTELDVSGFDTGNVTTMAYMFSDCSGLTELDMNGFDTGNVTTMTYMFRGCSGLTELDVSGFDTGNVTTMTYMFSDCSGLTELDASGFDTGNVTIMRGMFYGCSGLMKISVGENFAFANNTDFPELTSKYAWQKENNKQLFFSSVDMIAYHNDSDETNTYRKVAYVELTMDAKGGKFDDGFEKNTQIKVVDELWEAFVPVKENYEFHGWYLDEAYTRKFDFSQPATESLAIFAKWIEIGTYTVTIPAKISLNSEEKLTISGTNNGSGTLKVNFKETDSQINNFMQLRLIHKQNADATAHTTLSWEQLSSDIWNVLTIEPEASSVSKSADIGLTKPENVQAGDYEGQMVFSISYE
ncbi:hypothetical protein BCR25_06610 [Enterococcus termitis]|uniref:BspA family leucine-rich repeat surface protein n=3 Tax=Enterococcus termitis TaxID=332950 RepID=A0A1E5GKB1_9ENTE|nr:hypothetical protein BCR25_06610 [Enterococcus termitis]